MNAAEHAGRPETRQAIFEAATTLFERDGYAETGVREIAAAAGVTPALVIRYFGSKEQLFLAAMAGPNIFTDLLKGPLETFGSDLVAFVMAHHTVPGDTTGVFAALMRASDRPAVRDSLRALGEETFVGPLAARFAGPDADLRARLVAAAHQGLLGALELIGDPVLHASDAEAVAAYYGAAIQLLVDGRDRRQKHLRE